MADGTDAPQPSLGVSAAAGTNPGAGAVGAAGHAEVDAKVGVGTGGDGSSSPTAQEVIHSLVINASAQSHNSNNDGRRRRGRGADVLPPRNKRPSYDHTDTRGSNNTRKRTRRSAGAKRRRSSLFAHNKHALVGPTHADESATTWKQKIWSLVDEPGSSVYARFIAIFIMSLIGISCITFCLETLPQFHRRDEVVWYSIEAVCIVFFTIEYVTRLLSCPSLWPFLKGTLNTIDLVAIVPFYVELMFDEAGGSGSAVFRVVRLVRVFRVFKISRYVSWVKIFANAMYASAQPLGMLLFVMAIGCVVFSSAIYFAERGEWDPEQHMYLRDENGVMKPSPYQSIPASFWWCIITMTTVGYGDDVPMSVVGKLIAAVASLSGILVLAIPITVISTNFNYEFGRMKKKREAMRQKMLMFKRQFGAKNRQGLGIIKDEIEAIVRRNAAELMEDFQNVVQTSKDELGAELFALVQVAYRQRERLIAEQMMQDDTPSADVIDELKAEVANAAASLTLPPASGEGQIDGTARVPGGLPGHHNGSAVLPRANTGFSEAKGVPDAVLTEELLAPGTSTSLDAGATITRPRPVISPPSRVRLLPTGADLNAFTPTARAGARRELAPLNPSKPPK